KQSVTTFLGVQIVAAFLGAGGVVASGLIADRLGRRRTVGLFATLIAVFSGFAPTLLDGGTLGQDVFIMIGFTLLGLSYGQVAGALNASFEPRHRAGRERLLRYCARPPFALDRLRELVRSTLPLHTRSPSCSCASFRSL